MAKRVSKKGHKKMRGGLTLPVIGTFDVQGQVKSMVTKLLNDNKTAKDIIEKIKEKVPADLKPSKLIKMFNSPIDNSYIKKAFEEVRDGVSSALSDKGAGYRRRRKHKKM